MFARLRDPLGFPFRGSRPEGPVIAGWVLLLANALVPVVPLVPLAGYLLRVLGASAREEDAPPPAVEDLAGVVGDGLATFAVAAVYLLVPVVVLVVSAGGVLLGDPPEPGPASSLLVLAGTTTVLALAVLGAYLLPVGLVGVATGGLRAALDPGRARAVGGHAAYFVGWVRGAVALAAGAGLASLLGAVPVLGRVLPSLALAYALIVTARLWGRGVAATGAVSSEDPSRSEDAE